VAFDQILDHDVERRAPRHLRIDGGDMIVEKVSSAEAVSDSAHWAAAFW
jgi:hypothetical protein